MTLDDVNELMRGFKEMKKQFSEFRKMGILGNLLDPTRKIKKEKERELERMKKMGVNLFDPDAGEGVQAVFRTKGAPGGAPRKTTQARMTSWQFASG